jgi:hypothetical protein
MMGTQAAPGQLFYDFCLEDHVPDDHLLRRIDRFLDLSDVRQQLKPFYCTIGRPSIGADDPDAVRRLLPRHPLRASAMRRGSLESGLTLVLPLGA